MSRSTPTRPAVVCSAVVFSLGACATGAGTDTPVGSSTDRTTRIGMRGSAMDVRAISDEQVQRGLLLDTRDNVWARLPGVFQEIGVEVTYSNPTAYAMGNRGFRVRRIDGERPAEWVDCGMGPTARPYANEYEVTMGLTVQLHAVEEGTRADVRVDASAKPRDVSAASLSCRSKNTLERRILTLLDPG